MKSSFKKVEKPTQSQHTTFGHPDLDAVFNNNLGRGHLFVMEEDHPTTNYLSLLRYFVSSNYCEDRPTIIYDANPGKWEHLVAPPLKKTDKQSEGEEVKHKKSEIAWRYDNMNINLSELSIREDAVFFDLSKQIPKFNELLLSCHAYPSIPIVDFYKQVEETYMNTIQNPQSTSLIKLVLSSLPSYFYKSPQLPLFLAALRAMTRSSHLLTLITVPPIIPPQVREILIKYSDFYLQMQKIGVGYDHFCGSLTVVKEIQTGCIDTKNRGSTIWGIKNKKKQIRIESLYEQVIGESLADEGKSNANLIQF